MRIKSCVMIYFTESVSQLDYEGYTSLKDPACDWPKVRSGILRQRSVFIPGFETDNEVDIQSIKISFLYRCLIEIPNEEIHDEIYRLIFQEASQTPRPLEEILLE